MARKSYRKVFALVIAIAMIFAFTTVSQAAPLTIRYVTAWAKTIFETQQFLLYADMLQKEADAKYPGQLKLDYKGATEVIPNLEQVEALRGGMIDMVYTAASYYTSVMPEMDLMSLTKLSPEQERAAGVTAYLDQLHNKKVNAHFLGHLGTGYANLFYIFINKPIAKIEDFKGKKIRVSPTHVPFMKALGVEPVPTPPAEIYTAIERGVVDGFIQPIAPVKDLGLVPVTKFMITPGFYQPTAIALVNQDVWKKIPKNLQDLMTEVMKKVEPMNVENYKHHNEVVKKFFLDNGMKFTELPAEEGNKFVSMADKAMYDTVIPKAGEDGKKLFEMITKTK